MLDAITKYFSNLKVKLNNHSLLIKKIDNKTFINLEIVVFKLYIKYHAMTLTKKLILLFLMV